MPWAHRRNRHKGVPPGPQEFASLQPAIACSRPPLFPGSRTDQKAQARANFWGGQPSNKLLRRCRPSENRQSPDHTQLWMPLQASPNFGDVARRAGLMRSAFVQFRYIGRGKRSDPASRSNNKKTCCSLRQRHCQGRKESAGVRSTHPTEVFRRLAQCCESSMAVGGGGVARRGHSQGQPLSNWWRRCLGSRVLAHARPGSRRRHKA